MEFVPPLHGGCTSWPASCGSASSITSISCRCLHSRLPPPTVRRPASPGTSRLGRCLLPLVRGRDVACRRSTARQQFVRAFTLSKGLAGIGVGAWLGTIMLVQRLGADLAEPAEDSRDETGDGRGEEQGASHRAACVADQPAAVDPAAVLHGRRLGSHRALFFGRFLSALRLGEERGAAAAPDTADTSAASRRATSRARQSPYSFWTRSRRSCASSESVAVGRASSRGMPIGSPVSSQ